MNVCNRVSDWCEGSRHACLGFIYAIAESQLTGQEYDLAYTQETVSFCVNYSDLARV